jgi:hypothetical protein
MNSSMIGKIEKAHRYAKEPDRVRVQGLQATFHGSHDDYQIELVNGRWECSCHSFSSHALGTCAHIMAMQQLLWPMLSENDRYGSDDQSVSAGALPIAN